MANRISAKAGLLALISILVLGMVQRAAASSCPGDDNRNGTVTVDEILMAVNAALFGCSGPAPFLLQTGQTQCDQGSGTLGTCPGSPQGQDAAVAAGSALSYRDNGDGTISDNVTGLMWEKLSADSSVHDWTKTYTWQDAFSVKLAALNTPPCFAGHCDWRLPNRRELESLVDVGRGTPAIASEFNSGQCDVSPCTACSCTQPDIYWSSTSYQDPNEPGFAWTVNFAFGAMSHFEKIPDIELFVRAVRGGV